MSFEFILTPRLHLALLPKARYDRTTTDGWMWTASRLCLDLLNDELKQHIAASRELLLNQQW